MVAGAGQGGPALVLHLNDLAAVSARKTCCPKGHPLCCPAPGAVDSHPCPCHGAQHTAHAPSREQCASHPASDARRAHGHAPQNGPPSHAEQGPSLPCCCAQQPPLWAALQLRPRAQQQLQHLLRRGGEPPVAIGRAWGHALANDHHCLGLLLGLLGGRNRAPHWTPAQRAVGGLSPPGAQAGLVKAVPAGPCWGGRIGSRKVLQAYGTLVNDGL